MLGVSYAPDVGDTRYTPVELFTRLLIEDGHHVTLNDPYVNFWDELNLKVSDDFNNINDSLDAIVITTGNSVYKNNESLFN